VRHQEELSMTSAKDLARRAAARIGRTAALSVALVLAFGLPAANAQTSSRPRPIGAATSGSLVQNAVFNGYDAGYARGTAEARSAREFTPRGGGVFLAATTGYRSTLGSFEEYRGAFRRAYERGYADGYHGRDPDLGSMAPPVSGYSEIPADGRALPERKPTMDAFGAAATNGYDAGHKKGADDRKRGAGFSYTDSIGYIAATEGYSDSLGDRVLYVTMFRQVFARGYSDGYHGRAPIVEAGRVYDRAQRLDAPRRGMTESEVTELAVANGYHAGFERGASNVRARQTLAYRGDEAYRKATDGFDKAWDLQNYREAFRQGYELGYSDGYRQRPRDGGYEELYERHRDRETGSSARSGRTYESREDRPSIVVYGAGA
jgi:hypothetical protein